MFLGNPAPHVSLAHSVLHMLVYLSVSSPSSLSVESGADADPETDAVPVIGSPSDDLAFATEQPGKQPPLEHFRYRLCLFSLILALELLLLLLLLLLLHSLFLQYC